jgi:hypothetical protein
LGYILGDFFHKLICKSNFLSNPEPDLSLKIVANYTIAKKSEPEEKCFLLLLHNQISVRQSLGFVALAAWSSGIVSACHRGDWSYGP